MAASMISTEMEKSMIHHGRALMFVLIMRAINIGRNLFGCAVVQNTSVSRLSLLAIKLKWGPIEFARCKYQVLT